MRGPRPAARRRAAQAAGLEHDTAAAADLVSLLGDGDPGVVATALWALGRLHAAAHLPAIVPYLSASDHRVARAAIWATGQVGGADAAAALAARLRDAPQELLTPLLVALDHLPRALAIAALLPLVHDADGPTRSRASQALVRWGDDTARAIRAHLDPPESSVLQPEVTDLPPSPPGSPPTQHSALSTRRHSALVGTQHSPSCRRACAYILGATARTADDGAALIALTDDQDVRTRLHAIGGLGRLDDLAARMALQRLQAGERRDVREAAGRALAGPEGHVGTERPAARPDAVLPANTPLVLLVVPGLEGIAAAEAAALGAGAPLATARGYLVVPWGGPVSGLAALRTVEDVLLDGGALPADGPRESPLLAAALATFAAAAGLAAVPNSAYLRASGPAAQRAAGRAPALALLSAMGISTAQEGRDAAVPTIDVVGTGAGARLALPLFRQPLGRRPLAGGALPASLNATVAAAMVRLLVPERPFPAGAVSRGPVPPAGGTSPGGEVFLDPMCGAGTLLRERAAHGTLPAALLLGGDRDARAVERARVTLAGAPVRLAVWDATALPLDSQSVDAAACNPPYGRRTGGHAENQRLYPRALRELHRVLRRGGRAAVITPEKRLLEAALAGPAWRLQGSWLVDVGGLRPTIYLLERR